MRKREISFRRMEREAEEEVKKVAAVLLLPF